MTTTYDLMRGAARVQMEIEENSGLLSEETAAFLSTWIEQSEDKVLACMHLVRRMEAEAELLEAEEKRLRQKYAQDRRIAHVQAIVAAMVQLDEVEAYAEEQEAALLHDRSQLATFADKL